MSVCVLALFKLLCNLSKQNNDRVRKKMQEKTWLTFDDCKKKWDDETLMFRLRICVV